MGRAGQAQRLVRQRHSRREVRAREIEADERRQRANAFVRLAHLLDRRLKTSDRLRLVALAPGATASASRNAERLALT